MRKVHLKKYWGINLICMDVKTIKRTPIQIAMIQKYNVIYREMDLFNTIENKARFYGMKIDLNVEKT